MKLNLDPGIAPNDPGWDAPAALVLDNGEVVTMPEVTVREAGPLVEMAIELGEPIGGVIDPRRIRTIGPAV